MALLSGVCGFMCVCVCVCVCVHLRVFASCVDLPGAATRALCHSLDQHGQFTATLIYHLNSTCLTPN